MSNKPLDKAPRVISEKPDLATINQARRWIRGAAKLLAEASNGDPLVERLSREAMTLSVISEIVLFEYTDTRTV